MTPSEAICVVASYRALHPKLHALALSMQAQEGYYKNSRSWRNRNPLNLRSSPLADGNDRPDGSGLASFNDYFTGLAAALRDLWGKCVGYSSTGLDRESTVREMLAVWAPPNENDTEVYVHAVCERAGFSPALKLRELL